MSDERHTTSTGSTAGSAATLITPEDLRHCAALSRTALSTAMDRDWNTRAHDLDWTCRRSLDHIIDTLVFYASHLSTRATHRLPLLRNGDPSSDVADLLVGMSIAAGLLADVAQAAPSDARAFHPAGMGDPEGFLAMGCEEVLAHTWDITESFGLPFQPPDNLCQRITRRIFPWAPHDAPGWDALRWGAGRISLPHHPRLGADWWYHPAPLVEWDRSVKRRTSPPAWH
jgi:hypothetical protein